MRQQFWACYSDDVIELFLDYMNLFDEQKTWFAVCLLMNKGYAETEVDSLRREMTLCLEQIE